MTSTTDAETNELVYLRSCVGLLERRLEEQNAETRHWLAVTKHQLRVISFARQAVAWWPTVCDRYPRLAAPWVGALSLALAELDEDDRLRAALAERLDSHEPEIS